MRGAFHPRAMAPPSMGTPVVGEAIWEQGLPSGLRCALVVTLSRCHAVYWSISTNGVPAIQ